MRFDDTTKIDKASSPLYDTEKTVQLSLTDEFKTSLKHQILGMFRSFLDNDADEMHIKDLNPYFVMNALESEFKIETDWIEENGWEHDVWEEFIVTLPDGTEKTYGLWWQGYDGSFKIYKKEDDLE